MWLALISGLDPAQCEASLKRLGTDYIDLYQAHMWYGVTLLEEILVETLDALVRSGKVQLRRLLQLRELAAHEGTRCVGSTACSGT